MPLVLLQLLYEHSKTCLWCWLHIYWRKWKHWKGLSGWWYMVWYQPDVWRYDGVKIIFSTYFIGTAIICFKCECNSFTISNCTIMYYCSFIVKSCFHSKRLWRPSNAGRHVLYITGHHLWINSWMCMCQWFQEIWGWELNLFNYLQSTWSVVNTR